MKKITYLAAIAMIAISTTAVAQDSGATETFTADATIVSPISITNDQNLNFGEIAVSPTVGGTAEFDTDGVLTATGGVTTVSGSGATAAMFTVSGEDTYTYTITLPAPFNITETVDGIENMQITLSHAANEVLAGGTEAVTLGAQLDVAGAQAAGLYQGSFDVTVEYN